MAGLQTTDGWVARYSGVGGPIREGRAYLEGGGLKGPPRIARSCDVPPFNAAKDVEHGDDDHPARNGSLPTRQPHAREIRRSRIRHDPEQYERPDERGSGVEKAEPQRIHVEVCAGGGERNPQPGHEPDEEHHRRLMSLDDPRQPLRPAADRGEPPDPSSQAAPEQIKIELIAHRR